MADPKSQPPRGWGARPTLYRGGKIYNLMDAAMTAEQVKDFHKTAEAMFEYGMSIAAEIADVFNVVKPYGESGEI